MTVDHQSTPTGDTSRRVSLRGQDGQSLVLVMFAMAVILIIAALAIDVASWYQRHHQAQVAADSAALAAANYMAKGGVPTAATNTATTYAGANGIPIDASNVNVNTTSDAVTVTVATHASEFFEHFFGTSGPAVSARAVASWTAPGAAFSLFAGNQTCGTGLGLQFSSNGGGNQAVSGLFSNGQFNISSNSQGSVNGAFAWDQSTASKYCANPANTTTVPNGAINESGTSALPYPETFSQPTSGSGCTFSAPYFTTSTSIGNGTNNAVPVPAGDQITTPGVYCVTTGFTDTGGCTDDYQSSTNTGWIYIGTALTGAYEFVAPCVTLTHASSSLTAPSGDPLIYGTSNTTTPAPTPSGFSTCTNPSSTSVSTWVDDNYGIVLGAPIYDQCGTVEITGNNVFTGFIEAANITVDKNNAITGTGPTPSYELGNDNLSQ